MGWRRTKGEKKLTPKEQFELDKRWLQKRFAAMPQLENLGDPAETYGLHVPGRGKVR